VVVIFAAQRANAEASIKLAEPSKTAYRCGNTYTDNEEEAKVRGCKLVSADPSVQDQLTTYGHYREIAGNKSLKIFVDKSKVVKEGLLLKSWSVLSYNKPQPLPNSGSHQSVQSLEYYDCDARASATKRQVYYKDKIAHGVVMGSIDLGLKLEQAPPCRSASWWFSTCARSECVRGTRFSIGRRMVFCSPGRREHQRPLVVAGNSRTVRPSPLRRLNQPTLSALISLISAGAFQTEPSVSRVASPSS
jgi:hypothetical protein